ncbi:Endocytosis and vacuole integrity protein [Savitreella phatthalungensis]
MSSKDTLVQDVGADKKLPAAVRSLTDPIDAALAVADVKSAKHAPKALATFHRALSDGRYTLTDAQSKLLPDALSSLAGMSQECELKVLQLYPLLATSLAPKLHGTFLQDTVAMVIPFCSKPGISGSIATAGLQQLLVVLCDRDRPGSASTTADAGSDDDNSSADLLQLIDDLFEALDGKPCSFVEFAQLRPVAVLELLEALVDSKLVAAHPTAMNLPVLTSVFERSTIAQWEQAVRLARLCGKLLPRHASSLLPAWLAIAHDSSTPKHELALEALLGALPAIEHTHWPHIVQALLTYEAEIPGVGTYSYAQQGRGEEVVSVDGTEVFSRELPGGLGSWLSLTKPLLSTIHTPPSNLQLYRYLLVFRLVCKLCNSPSACWRDLLILISAFLSSSISRELEGELFTAVATAVRELDSSSGRMTYMRRIGRSAVSSSLTDGGRPTSRSLAFFELFTTIVHDLQDSFDAATWVVILQIFAQADALFRASISSRARSSNGPPSIMSGILGDVPPSPVEPQRDSFRQAQAIDDFFSGTKRMPNDAFLVFINALCSFDSSSPLSPKTPSTPHFSPPGSPVSLHRRQSSRTSISLPTTSDFDLRSLAIVTQANLERFSKDNASWTALSSHLKAACLQEKDAAAEILAKAILDLLQAYQVTDRPALINNLTALESFSELLAETTLSVISSTGHELTADEWRSVLSALSRCDESAIRPVYSAVQLICNDFVSDLPAFALADVCRLCSTLVRQPDLNIALTASNLTGGVLVSAGHRGSEALTTLWPVYSEIVLLHCQDPRPEVRDPAIQNLFLDLDRLPAAMTTDLKRLINEHLLENQPPGVSASTARLLLTCSSRAVADQDDGILLGGLVGFLTQQLLSIDSEVVAVAAQQTVSLLSSRQGAENIGATLWPQWRTSVLTCLSPQHAALQRLPQSVVAAFAGALVKYHGLGVGPDQHHLELARLALLYDRSSDYLLDFDYPSETQKAVLQLISAIEPFPVGVLGAALEEALTRDASLYPEVRSRQSAAGWSGTPTFIAFADRVLILAGERAADLTRMRGALRVMVDTRAGASASLSWKPRMPAGANAGTGASLTLWKRASTMMQESGDLGLAIDALSALFISKPSNDEEFILQALNRLQATALPRLEAAAPEQQSRYVAALIAGSNFVDDEGTPFTDQILREWCWLELLRLSSRDGMPSGLLDGACDRAHHVVNTYITASPLRGNAPLQDHALHELRALLQHLADTSIDHPAHKMLLKRVFEGCVEGLVHATAHAPEHPGSQALAGLSKDFKRVVLRAGQLL